MRLPKWNRKQKTVRNLALAAALLLLAEWVWGFPVWTADGVLRRGEQEYLLEGTELLFSCEEKNMGTVYGRCGSLLLAVTYSKSPLGLHPGFVYHYEEADGILCTTKDWWPLKTMAFGALEHAYWAELEVAVHWDGSSDGRRWDLRRTYRAEGVRQNAHCFTFTLEPFYAETDDCPEAEMERSFFDGQGPGFTYHAVLRLWDENGELLHQKEMKSMVDETFLTW